MKARLASAWQALRRHRLRQRLVHPEFAHLLEPAPEGQWVALDCETTGLQAGVDEVIAIGAVRLQGDRILTSGCLDLRVRPQHLEAGLPADSVRVHQLRAQDVAGGLPLAEAVRQLLHFIGPRPLVGYHLAFDVAMLQPAVRVWLGFGLPQPQIDVASLYRRHKLQQMSAEMRFARPEIDLRLPVILRDLGLPDLPAHDAVNDAVMAGLAFTKLRHLGVL